MTAIEEYIKGKDEDCQNAEDMSLFVWHPDFDKDKTKLLKRVHTIADKLFRYYRSRNVKEAKGKGKEMNPMSNYDLYEGNLNEEKFVNLTEANGDTGNSVLKDYSFYKAPVARLIGKYLGLPLGFSVEKVGQYAAIEETDREIQRAVEKSMRQLAAAMAQDGVDMSKYMTDPEIYVPQNEQEAEDGTKEIERTIFDLVEYIIYKYRLHNQLAECLLDKAIVNEQYMEIVEGRENPEPQRRDPRQVAIVGEITNNNLEGCDCVGIIEMVTLSKVVQEYGHLLRESGRYEEFVKELRSIYRTQTNWPQYTDGTMEKTIDGGSFELSADYFMSGTTFWDSRIAVQRFYTKMVKFQKNRITIDGRPLTKEELALKKEGLFERLDDLLYEPVDDDYEAVGNETIHSVSYLDLYQGVRLGNKYLIRWGRAQNQVRKEDNLRVPEYPLKGYLKKEKSLVSIGESLNDIYISCFYQIRKLINNMGSKTVNYDLSQMPEGYTEEDVLYEMKEVNINFYNSQQIKGTPNVESSKHLTVNDLGVGDDIIRLVNLAMLMSRTYGVMIGLPVQSQGVVSSREAMGQTRDMIDMGEIMSQPFYFDHNEFTHQVFQQIGERGRFLWAKDEVRRYVIGSKGVKTLRLSKNIDLYRYGFFLTGSFQDQKDKDFIQNLVMQSIPAGAATLREAIAVYNAKNPKSAEDIFEKGMSTMERLQKEANDQRAATDQAKAQAEQMKVQSPERVADMNNQVKMVMQQALIEFEREKLGMNDALKRDMTDNKAETDMLKQQVQAANAIDQTQAEQAIAAQNKPLPTNPQQ